MESEFTQLQPGYTAYSQRLCPGRLFINADRFHAGNDPLRVQFFQCSLYPWTVGASWRGEEQGMGCVI